MSAVNSRAHAVSASAPSVDSSPLFVDSSPLFKEDRPKKIDRFISFFGDSEDKAEDVCGEQLLDSFAADPWSER